MNRPVLVAATFAAGIAVGAIAMRAWFGTSSTAPQVIETVIAPAAAVPHGDARESTPAATPLSAVKLPSANTTSESAPPPMPAPAGTPLAATNDVVQPIEVGDVFRKMIAKESVPGNENQIGDAHRELEREYRDEGWAYTMEAELQNSMLNEVATSGFNPEHIECRATLCEVRLSGTGQQQAAGIKRWNESFMGQNSVLGQRLLLSYAAAINDNERTNALLIFRRPPPPDSPQSAPKQAPQKRG